MQDMFTSLTGASKPHHMVDPDSGVVLGYSHFGMLAAARWLQQQLMGTLQQAMQEHPGYLLLQPSCWAAAASEGKDMPACTGHKDNGMACSCRTCSPP